MYTFLIANDDKYRQQMRDYHGSTHVFVSEVDKFLKFNTRANVKMKGAIAEIVKYQINQKKRSNNNRSFVTEIDPKAFLNELKIQNEVSSIHQKLMTEVLEIFLVEKDNGEANLEIKFAVNEMTDQEIFGKKRHKKTWIINLHFSDRVIRDNPLSSCLLTTFNNFAKMIDDENVLDHIDLTNYAAFSLIPQLRGGFSTGKSSPLMFASEQNLKTENSFEAGYKIPKKYS